MRDWYAKHLGINSEAWGATFPWRRAENPEEETYTAWSPFKEDTTYLNPSQHDFMVNYQVDDLHALFEQLKNEGVTIVGEIDESEFGKFGWILDPEGRKIELWEPPK